MCGLVLPFLLLANGTVIFSEDVGPFVVAILKGSEYKCTGVLINNKTVLTVATCVAKFRRDKATVLVGASLNATGAHNTGEKIESDGMFVHPDFFANGNPDYKCNVGIIKLAKEITRSKMTRPGAIAKLGDAEPSAGASVETVGWGATSATEAPSGLKLTKAKVSVATSAACAARPNIGINTAYHICTTATAGRRPTKGDWGSPLISYVRNRFTDYESYAIYGLLYAIGSRDNEATAYIKVANHAEWINEQANPPNQQPNWF